MKYFVVGIITTVTLGVTFIAGALCGAGIVKYDEQVLHKDEEVKFEPSHPMYSVVEVRPNA